MATSSLDFGELSLQDALDLKSKQSDMIDVIRQYLDEAPAYTKSGKDIKNMSTSKAKMVSASRAFPLPEGVEGKTVSDVVKRVTNLTNDNAMLDAIIAAKTPVQVNQVPAISVRPPSVPGVPAPAVPGISATLSSKLNPILMFLQGLTYPTDLNVGEDEEIAARRKYNKENFNGN